MTQEPSTREDKPSDPIARITKERRVGRLAEAAMLLCMSLVLWLIIGTNKSFGGLLLLLDQLHPTLARVYVVLTVLVLLGILGACLVVGRGATRLGTVLCAASLIVFTAIQNGPVRILESFVPKEDRAFYSDLRFYSDRSELEGSELYVNGVLLGTLPLEISEVEFRTRVPVWKEPPADLNWRDVPSSLKTYSGPSGGFSKASQYQRLDLKQSLNKPEYYAQVKYSGQWCYTTSQGGSIRYRDGFFRGASFRLNFRCLEREQTLERLLDWARMKDFQVSDVWIETLETYGQDGVEILIKAASNEPGTKDLLDQWASRRFRLDHVNDEATAWQAFERICQAATKAKAYSTEGLEGRAVTWLAPKLRVDELADQAIQLLKGVDRLDWRYWKVNGIWQFGYGPGMVTSSPETAYSGSMGVRPLPTKGYAVAHALKILFEQGDPRARDVLQHQVAPEILASFYQDLFMHGMRHRLLSAVGGPVLESFLFRQNWEADPKQLSARQCVRTDVGRLNGWFYMLTYLQTATGRQFRQAQRDRLFEIADEVDRWSKREGLGFLFLDPDQGKDSLAYQYWPRFLKNLAEEKMWDSRHMNLAYAYLIKMEPITEPNRYVEAFMALEPQRLDSSISFRALASAPQSRKPGVYRAMKEAFEGDISQLKNMTGRLSLDSFRADLLHKLKGVLGSDLENAEQLYREIVERRSDRSTVGWLHNLSSDHALIPMLAKSDRADLRRLALYTIECHPSAAHRALLETLLQDTDPDVSTAAGAVKKHLNTLANMQVETLKAR